MLIALLEERQGYVPLCIMVGSGLNRGAEPLWCVPGLNSAHLPEKMFSVSVKSKNVSVTVYWESSTGLSGQEIIRHRVTREVPDLRKLAVWKGRCRNLGAVRGILPGWQSGIAAV